MRSFYILTIMLVLTACGGGGSVAPLGTLEIQSAPPITTSTSFGNTKVIDGYIEGANVFYDMNYNLLQDEGEPSAYYNSETGDYYFKEEDFTAVNDFSVSCAYSRPRIAQVPVGAYDSDRGYVENAYTMYHFPEVHNPSDRANVTPFTTLFLSFVDRFKTTNITVADGCNTTANELSYAITEEVIQVMTQLTSRWQMSATTLYEDYIASGDTQLQAVGEKVVDFLTTIYTVNDLLEAEYNASFIAPVDHGLIDTIMSGQDFDTVTFNIYNNLNHTTDGPWDIYTQMHYHSLVANSTGQLLDVNGDVYDITLANLSIHGNLSENSVAETREPLFSDQKVKITVNDLEGEIDFGTWEDWNITRFVVDTNQRTVRFHITEGYSISISNSSNTYLDYDPSYQLSVLDAYQLEDIYNELQSIKVDINSIVNNRFMLYETDSHRIETNDWWYSEENNYGESQTCINRSTGEIWYGTEAYNVCSQNL